MFANLCVQNASLLNLQLAFFLHDIMSVMDRGFVFSLVRTYCRVLVDDKNQHDVLFVTSLKVRFSYFVSCSCVRSLFDPSLSKSVIYL